LVGCCRNHRLPLHLHVTATSHLPVQPHSLDLITHAANACSGFGECRENDQCECYSGYFGGDCSLRVCPAGLGFVDTPRGDLNHDGVSARGWQRRR
jgi:hypothetical protein